MQMYIQLWQIYSPPQSLTSSTGAFIDKALTAFVVAAWESISHPDFPFQISPGVLFKTFAFKFCLLLPNVVLGFWSVQVKK